MSSDSKFGGLIIRKPAWVLTWRGRLLAFIILLGAAILVVRNAHAFLAVNAPVSTGVLVVEGWAPQFELTNFINRCANYQMIYTTGGPVHPSLTPYNVSDTHASVAYWLLRRNGVPPEKIHMVPSFVTRVDRTYASALALREWSQTNHVELRGFDIVTLGPHARRSRLLYQKAFGAGAKIGVISIPGEGYDAHHWWRFSEGVKETLSEGAAYLYARFLFFPN